MISKIHFKHNFIFIIPTTPLRFRGIPFIHQLLNIYCVSATVTSLSLHFDCPIGILEN